MGPLAGMVVIDLGMLVQGPQAAAVLADMGARVTKVELPGVGDQARWLPLARDDLRLPYLVACNRGKRSITCDLRTPAGREVLLRLVDRADVLVANFSPGTLEQWGLGYEDLSVRNPRLVHATGSAYGHLGPDARREGADLGAQAAGGLISTIGRPGEAPSPVGATVADVIASQQMVSGILAALLVRERTGRGQQVQVSLLGGQVWAMAGELTAALMLGHALERTAGGHPLVPLVYGLVETADGWLALVGVPPRQRAAFFAAIGRPDLAADARYMRGYLDRSERAALFAELQATFRTRTTEEWAEVLREAGQRYAPVRDLHEVAIDHQTRENGYVVEVDHPTDGPTLVVGVPIHLSETPLEPGVVAPELGQHTEEVLLELGYSWDEIGEMRESGAI